MSSESSSFQQERNIITFGGTGAGKSSLANLLFGHAAARTSPNVGSCRLQTTKYSLLIDSNVYHLYDAVGLNSPQLAKRSFLDVIKKAYKLVGSLGRGVGIHFLVFCMRGDRLLATAQNNYRLFYEFLCQGRVPVVPTITRETNAQRYDESRAKLKAMIEESIAVASFSMERHN